jgi:hypothetical protein
MATRIEPFRDYSEHEVINLFALEAPGTFAALREWKPANSDVNDAGVVVAPVIAKSKLPGELPSKESLDTSGVLRQYLGASGQPNVGYNAYNMVEMTVAAADTDVNVNGAPLGITLKQTLAYDENDENLLRYPLKKDELQAVLPGHAVPILTRGLVLLNAKAFAAGQSPEVGDALEISADAGKLQKEAVAGAGPIVGRCVGTDGANKRLCKLSF